MPGTDVAERVVATYYISRKLVTDPKSKSGHLIPSPIQTYSYRNRDTKGTHIVQMKLKDLRALLQIKHKGNRTVLSQGQTMSNWILDILKEKK